MRISGPINYIDKSQAGFSIQLIYIFKRIYENSAKENASLCMFPSAVLCKLKVDTLLIRGGVVNSCWIKTLSGQL